MFSAILDILRFGICDAEHSSAKIELCEFLLEDEEFYPGFEYQ